MKTKIKDRSKGKPKARPTIKGKLAQHQKSRMKPKQNLIADEN
jgi:hypothetical protein